MAITKPGFATVSGAYELVAGFFAGGQNIYEEWKAHGGLRNLLLRVNTAVEALIDLVEDGTGDIVCGTLSVGASGAAYAAGSYLIVDGTTYPRAEGFIIADQGGGTRVVTMNGGAWNIV